MENCGVASLLFLNVECGRCNEGTRLVFAKLREPLNKSRPPILLESFGQIELKTLEIRQAGMHQMSTT